MHDVSIKFKTHFLKNIVCKLAKLYIIKWVIFYLQSKPNACLKVCYFYRVSVLYVTKFNTTKECLNVNNCLKFKKKLFFRFSFHFLSLKYIVRINFKLHDVSTKFKKHFLKEHIQQTFKTACDKIGYFYLQGNPNACFSVYYFTELVFYM